MKRRFLLMKIIITAVMCMLCIMSFCACGRDEVTAISLSGSTEIEIGSFDYSDYTLSVTYESGREESIALTSDMLGASDNIKFFNEGTQEITVEYGGKTCTFSLAVKAHTFTDLSFPDITTFYTGETVTAEVLKNYPDGTDVYYPNGNKFVSAGVYEVTAIVSRQNYVTETLTATVTIKKAVYDMTAVTFTSQDYDYNGREHSLTISGKLPSGVSVSYPDGNTKIDAGDYSVLARFTGDEVNYEPIPDRVATLTINKKHHNTTGLTFNDSTVVYDGKPHSLEVKNCPSGVSVRYEVTHRELVGEGEDTQYETITDGTAVTDADTYTYKAIFTSDDCNYEDIRPITATLTITKAEYDVSDIYLDGDEVTYDGKPHSLSLKRSDGSALLDDVYVLLAYYQKNGQYIFVDDEGNYSYDDIFSDDDTKILASSVTEYGTYTYTAILWPKSDNYRISEDFTAILTINKATYDTSAVALVTDEFIYDGDDVVVSVTGLPSDTEGNKLGYTLYYFDEQPEFIVEDSGSGSGDGGGDVTAEKDLPYNNYLVNADGAPVTSVKDQGTYWVMIVFTNQTNENYNYLQPMVKVFYVE